MDTENYLLNYSDSIAQQIFGELTNHTNEPEIHEIIPLLLFQTMLDKIKALQILRDSGETRVGDSAYGITRTVYEYQWNLLYMIKEDSKFRATAYYYFSRLDEAKSGIKDIKYKLSLRMDKRKKDIQVNQFHNSNPLNRKVQWA